MTEYDLRPVELQKENNWNAHEIVAGLLIGDLSSIQSKEALEYFEINGVVSILSEEHMNKYKPKLETVLNPLNIKNDNNRWLCLCFEDEFIKAGVQNELHTGADFIHAIMTQNEFKYKTNSTSGNDINNNNNNDNKNNNNNNTNNGNHNAVQDESKDSENSNNNSNNNSNYNSNYKNKSTSNSIRENTGSISNDHDINNNGERQPLFERKNYIMVHCFAGVSRSPTIVAAYMIKYLGYGCNDALKLIRSKRSHCRPKYFFMTELDKFEKDVKKQALKEKGNSVNNNETCAGCTIL